MALPINIKELVHGKVVEWERLEFKAGWNPENILHSICAFANDINNWGGGYIIVGIEAIDGVPQFPPKGLPLNKLDEMQGELINICHKIQPNYLPIVQPYIIEEQHILVIWAPAGDMRPYSGPSTLGDDARRQMQIARGPVEFLRPVNVGLMFFNREPHKFFNRAWIELAIHPDDTGRNFITETLSRREILSFLGLANQTNNFTNNIKPLIDMGIIELTIPNKPNSRLQKYKLTSKGRKLLK
ncbi:MAG: ATP-binding protein [Porphyromonadaceae bacterium]|nr:MAG: ATP-binding protein [Porphyromonadaceae bacterium]